LPSASTFPRSFEELTISSTSWTGRLAMMIRRDETMVVPPDAVRR